MKKPGLYESLSGIVGASRVQGVVIGGAQCDDLSYAFTRRQGSKHRPMVGTISGILRSTKLDQPCFAGTVAFCSVTQAEDNFEAIQTHDTHIESVVKPLVRQYFTEL